MHSCQFGFDPYHDLPTVVLSGLNVSFHCVGQGSVGSQTVTVSVGGMSKEANDTFTFDLALTPQITDLSPAKTTVFGKSKFVLRHMNPVRH